MPKPVQSILVCFVFLSVVACENHQTGDNPNIILIMADDLGYGGINISELLFNERNLEDRDVFWRYRGSLSMREGSMKLLINPEDTLLFDLSKDIREENNLAPDSLNLLNTMSATLRDWDTEMNKYPQKTR